MKAAQYHNNKDIRIIDIPVPKIGEGELLIKVISSGICGTDVMEWYRIKKAPRILGHEIAGEVVESRSDKFKVGQRVFVNHHVPCNSCKYCMAGNHTACETLHKGNYDPGGFSEFVRVPKINADAGTYLLPDSVSYDEGTMIEPLGCVVRGQRLIDIKKGQTVLILGSGFSGLMNIKMAKLKGAYVIATDINEFKLKKAKEYGADRIVNATTKLDIKADKIIVCTGAYQAIVQAFETIDRKGTILLFAIPDRNIEVPTVDFWRNEITMTSSYGAGPVDLEEALTLINNKKVDVKSFITHKFPLNDIQKGFDTAASAKDSMKVLIKP
ncbi:MAG: alcohol dehydrogenase catalytic domain-containing protein [Candidatus Saganbacteria bacterium]|nr:alcohol dehydrogenase catalytic domain-containing protein [Candidatus Saganbacteria bacterium]